MDDVNGSVLVFVKFDGDEHYIGRVYLELWTWYGLVANTLGRRALPNEQFRLTLVQPWDNELVEVKDDRDIWNQTVQHFLEGSPVMHMTLEKSDIDYDPRELEESIYSSSSERDITDSMNLYTLADALPDLNSPVLEANEPTNVCATVLPTWLIPD
ncbi:hypothetical protein WN943_021753 [Citrus x changshan-huyou]